MQEEKEQKGWLPVRHPNLDFFICNIVDCAPRDDQESMTHPMFSLSSRRDLKVKKYEHNGAKVTITPSIRGAATIFDKDILIYCESQIIEAFDRGRDDINRKVMVTVYDLLVATNRGTSGACYRALEAALKRLKGTSIFTNISTNGVRVKKEFGLIEEWEIVEKSQTDGRMMIIEITLSTWFYNALLANHILSINPDYFRLRKPLERRLYELARKHCGRQASWSVGLDLLWKKSGSDSKRKEFRRMVIAITKANNLPDYRVVYKKEKDLVTFYNRAPKGCKKQIDDIRKQN